MAKKTTKITKTKKPKKTSPKKKKGKSEETSIEDMGIVVIDDDLEIDKDAELEARKAYLEEARSQEAFD